MSRILALLLLCLVSATAIAQGPMSSGYKAPQPSAEQTPAATAKDAKGQLDVNKLIPRQYVILQLTTLTDAEIANRIKNGKPGQMPSFAGTFSDDDIKAIIRYIRELKES